VTVDSNSWLPTSCGQFPVPITASCWTEDLFWLYSLDGECSVRYIHFENCNGSVRSTEVLASPFEISIEDILTSARHPFEANLSAYSISSLVVDYSTKRLCVSFSVRSSTPGDDEIEVLPFIAVFMLQLQPTLALQLKR
jgi:hypothetical protein